MKLFAPWFHARKTPLGTRKTRIFTLLPSPPAFNISPDNESKRDAHPQDIGMSRPPHGGARESTLSQVPHFYRVSFSKRPFCQGIAPEKFRLWGYYTPTPPLRGCYTLALPHLFVCSSFERPFCQGTAPKKFARQACKIFRALDNDEKLKSKHARSGSPPRALIVKLYTLFIISTSFLMCSFSISDLSSC